MYMSGAGNIYDQASAANLFGQGAQVTAQGTYVPQPDGTYQLVPHGQAAGALTNYGNTYDPTTAGGGMYGSQYGATGPDLNQQAPQNSSGIVTRAPAQSASVRSPYSGATSAPSTSPYAADGSYVLMPGQGTSFNPYPNGLPSGLGGASGQNSGQQALSPAASSVLAMGDMGASTAPSGAGNPGSLDMTSLMAMLGQFTGNQQSQPLPTSGPTGMNYDSALIQYLQQAMGQTGSQLDYGAGTTPQIQQSQQSNGDVSGAMVNLNSIYKNTPGQFGNGYDPAPANPLSGMINHTYTSVGGVPVNSGQTGQTTYSNGQNAPSTNPLGGMIPFPLPGGSGQGGSVGIPLPTPTPISQLPVGAPVAAPVAPWNQTGTGQTSQPQTQTPAATTPQSWNGVATTGGGISDSLRAMLGANVMGSGGGASAGAGTGADAAIQQALLSNPSYVAQQQQQQSQAPAQQSSAQSFDFGGTTAAGTTQQTTATSGGSSNSLLSLLGGLPQPPDLQITPPTVDASGNFANMPGGEAIRSAIQPVLNSQQIGQLQNQATGQNARQAATAENLARENMAARGFSAGSGALGDTNQQIAAARMMADTQANSQIPIGAAKLNNDSMMQQLGLNLQGQQNAISSYGQMSDMLKNNAALGAQTYGLGIQGYNAYQNALNNLLNNQLQSQGLGVQQYGQDVNAYNAQQNAMNNYLQNYLAANQLQLSGNNANYQNWLGLGNLLNNSTATDNQFTSSLLNSLLGAA